MTSQDRDDTPADDERVEASKFALGGPVPAVDAGELPWGYGEDRITVMVRDPESAYLYWEITDPGLASARGRLGPAGAEGWGSLRVYDKHGLAETVSLRIKPGTQRVLR